MLTSHEVVIHNIERGLWLEIEHWVRLIWIDDKTVHKECTNLLYSIKKKNQKKYWSPLQEMTLYYVNKKKKQKVSVDASLLSTFMKF